MGDPMKIEGRSMEQRKQLRESEEGREREELQNEIDQVMLRAYRNWPQ